MVAVAKFFVSCGFESESEKARGDWAARVLRALGHEVVWLGGPGASSQAAMRQAPRAGEHDGLVAFVTSRGGRAPPGVEQELVLATRDELPILAFVADGVRLAGLLSTVVIPRVPLEVASTAAGEARVAEFAANVAPSGLVVELTPDEGDVQTKPLTVLQKFRIVNKGSKAISGVEIGLVCSSETAADALLRVLGDDTPARDLPAIPRALAGTFDVDAPAVVKTLTLSHPLGPLAEVEFLAGYRGHSDPFMSRYVHFGIWVGDEGRALFRGAYAGGITNYHEPSFKPVLGPPFLLYEVTEGGPTMSRFARRRAKAT